MRFSKENLTLKFNFRKDTLKRFKEVLDEYLFRIVVLYLVSTAIASFFAFYQNGLNLAYNDARSHLDIARRVVEGLKPGVAQLGSVWLPLLHVLMLPTIWVDAFWHSGFSGAVVSMTSFVITGILIFKFLEKLKVGYLGKIVGLLFYSLNLNVLYLSSSAMTELLILATTTASIYYLSLWARNQKLLDLIKSSFWLMASTLTRYDGWFLFLFTSVVVVILSLRNKGSKAVGGHLILFATLASLGIVLWFLWNLLIFKDPLYFIFGPFSARSQQAQLEAAGELPTKGNFLMSFKAFLFALLYNLYTYPAIAGMVGLFVLWLDKRINLGVRIATFNLFVPFIFNVLALYMGHSVLFLPNIIGETWFNVRYGITLLSSLAISFGYLVERVKNFRFTLVLLFLFTLFFVFTSRDAVTIDDAVYGASQKNVYEVSTWLKENAGSQKGFILISAASHDAIIFSSGLPMKRFIHEGTGAYWDFAVENPERWATWIVMRTYDLNDLTYKEVHDAEGLKNFELVDHYPFADIYQLKPELRQKVVNEPILGKLK